MGFVLLSTQRSMSSFVMNVIKSHSDVRMLNEPLGNHVNLYRKLDLYNSDSLEKSCSPTIKERNYHKYYLDSLNSWLDYPKAMSGIKEVLFLNKMEWIKIKFPDCKIIVLLRDPRGVVEALVRRNLDLRWGYTDLLTDYFKANNLHDIVPASRYMQAALIWKIRVSPFVNSIENQNVLVTLAEDFVFKFENEIEEIMFYLGLKVEQNQITFAKKCWSEERGGIFSNYHKKEKIYEWKRKLSKADERAVIEITGEFMEKLGYI